MLSRATGADMFGLSVDGAWLADHDLTDYELAQEVAEWRSLQVTLAIERNDLAVPTTTT
jgi:hypothetical protein